MVWWCGLANEDPELLAFWLEVLGMLQERLEDAGNPPMDSPVFNHLLTEALKHGFADRARYLADPDFAPVPIDTLQSPHRITAVASTIDLQRTQPSTNYGVVGPPRTIREQATTA